MSAARWGVRPPDLEWTDAGPRSRAFDDVYYSAQDGLAEAQAVFMAGAGLPEAWAGRSRFVVGELGFGAGVNLLALWALWRAHRPPGAWLWFQTIEGRPFPAEDAARAHAAWPALRALSGPLVAQWPPAIPGRHRLRFDTDGLIVDVFHGEAGDGLAALDDPVDAWFLDGFAPSRNPEMWRPALYPQIARASAPGARLATYTVAGAVRQGLTAAGFAVEKRPGFGKKRERLEARYSGPAHHPRGNPLRPPGQTREGAALIIGAGLAGAACAFAARRRGMTATLIDAEGLAAGASGNPLGLVMPRLDLEDRPEASALLAAYAYALNLYAGWPEAFSATGAVQIAISDTDATRFAKQLGKGDLPPAYLSPLNVEAAGARVGEALDHPALWHGAAGVAQPEAITRRLVGDAPLIRARVARLAPIGEDWAAFDADGAEIARAPMVVLASGPALHRLSQTATLPIRPSRGQLSVFACTDPPACALAFGAYAAPLGPDRLLVGATYDPWVEGDPLDPTVEGHARNRQDLAAVLPQLADRCGAVVGGRAAVRATTPDRWPMVGSVVDAPAYAERFAGLAQGRRRGDAPGPVHAGLYVLGGLGSRGLVWAPLLGEQVIAQALGEPEPLTQAQAAALHPARFLARDLKRGRTPA
ncbi:MAG: bifunctional tRNA (5-methylaminomethyl-2-thiouridine)(34)-methyltransferase MnmD/FAD-dependent 5-carboxymethylaminomethyl-2-thiouridine(34) oxidoreductase MnmC [Maricaulaceae bacterium]